MLMLGCKGLTLRRWREDKFVSWNLFSRLVICLNNNDFAIGKPRSLKLFQIQSQKLFLNIGNSFWKKMTVAFAVIFMALIEKQL